MWVQRGAKRYFYRSVRRSGRVEKVYHGTGLIGEVAAAADDLRRAELKAQRQALQTEQGRCAEVLALSQALTQASALLLEASFLAAGFHRQQRHPWRIWRRGKKLLNTV